MLHQEIRRIDSVQELSSSSDAVWIAGGTFRMGSDDHYPEEAIAHSDARSMDSGSTRRR